MIKIVNQPFNAFEELATFQSNLDMNKYGANCNFIGTMRDYNENTDVVAMSLEHYPSMAEKQLHKIVDQVSKGNDIKVLIIHRVGHFLPGESIVLTSVWSAHRKQGFEACRFLIEKLKHNAPFWKKETLKDGSTRWVETNSPA